MASSARALRRDDIPVIDIGPLLDDSDPQRVAAQLQHAATQVGFIYVSNHGVADEVIDQAHAIGLEFFRQPLEKKLEVATNKHHHGYLRPGATKMYDNAEVDLKESFNFGIELDAATLVAHQDNSLLGANEWPAFVPEFQPAVYRYFEAATRCAEALLRGFALAGGHPSDVFTRHSDLPVSRGSLQYYPPQPADAAENRFGLAAHTDFGVLTVLAQDRLGGLEIELPNGEWVKALPIEGTLVINVGDLLARWSNGVFRSTPHRVINTSGKERLSLVLAYDPNAETVIDPRLFCAPGETPKYETTTCGEYLLWRFAKAFAYRNA